MSLMICAVNSGQFLHAPDDPHHDGYFCVDRYQFVHAADPVFNERLDGLATGCYLTPAARWLDTGASSGAYSVWRNVLSLAVHDVEATEVWSHPEMYHGTPFYELIDMSDAEGTIGSVTSAKLAKDFEEFLPGAKDKLLPYETMLEEEGWSIEGWIEKYKGWAEMFQFASTGGFVTFHG